MKQIIACILMVLPMLGFASLKQECEGNRKVAPDKRYQLKKNGVAFDKQTRLYWQRCSYGQLFNNGVCEGQAVSMIWDEAMAAAKEFTDGENSNWRLPSVAELSTLIESNCVNPAINLSVFPNTKVNHYWTSKKGNDIDRFLVFFGRGHSAPWHKNSHGFFRLVRD